MENKETQLVRALGLKESISMTIGTVVGVGLFTCGSAQIGHVGSWIIVITFLSLLISIWPCLIYGEMSAALPCAGGLTRNLLPSEMLDQIYRIQTSIGERISNVVVMGTGEPLDNYDNLLRFIHILTEDGGIHISQRNLTVSTCGLVPKIYELAEEKLQMTLAVSLHAPNDEKRRELMPIANIYSIDELLAACRNYFDKTGRRITFEYSLVAGVNDSKENAQELAGRLKGLNCHVNLIPVNPVRERSFVRSTREAVENFKINLEKCGINGTIRREMGSDIDGACGQLRKRYMEKTESEK